MASIRVPRESHHKHSSQAFFSSAGRLFTPSGRKRPKWKVSVLSIQMGLPPSFIGSNSTGVRPLPRGGK